jgi:hypothetical protein
MPSRLKKVTLEEIPNITSDIIEKLRELNIKSVSVSRPESIRACIRV